MKRSLVIATATSTHFATRRMRNLMVMLVVTVSVCLALRGSRDHLEHVGLISGYLLYAIVTSLISLHWRKQLPAIPLGAMSTWMQLHIYLGIGGIAVFLEHIGWKLPQGLLESIAAILYTATTLSGLWGLFLTRTLPRRLSVGNEQFLWETIPVLRSQVATEARQLMTQAVAHDGAATLSEFYQGTLSEFLETTPGLRFLLYPTPYQRRRVMAELNAITRYLSAAEQNVARRLFQLTRKKDELEYHYALQWILKSWLTIHLALSYSLLIVVTIHGALAHAFAGMAP